MRIIAVNVERKVCATARCQAAEYEGQVCPTCGQGFDPTRVRKTDQELLIVVDVVPTIYAPTQQCRCTQCGNLFELTGQDIVARSRCQHCKTSLFERAQLQRLWRNDGDSLLLRARHLDRACRELGQCSHCHQSLTVECWCPLWRRHEDHRDESCLPTRTGETWVRQ